MSTVSEDKQALEYLIQNPTDPDAPAMMQILGIDHDDLEAVKESQRLLAETPDEPEAIQMRNIVFDKIAENRPAVETEGGLPLGDRLVVKNLIDTDPALQQEYLNRKGYITRIKDDELEFKRPGQVNYQRADPRGFDKFDIFDHVTDVLEGVVTGAATVAKGAGAALAPLTGGAALPTAMLAGGTATALFETGKQSAAQLLGARSDFDAGEIGKAFTRGAVIPGVTKAAGGLFKLASKGTKGIQSKFSGKLKEGAEEIEKAAEEVGAKATPGQLFENKIIGELESAQYQSGGLIGGQATRALIEGNKKAVQETADAIVADAAEKSAFEVGDAAGKSLAKSLAKKLEPAEAIYTKLEKQFRRKAYTPDLKPLKKTIGFLKKELSKDKKGLKQLADIEEEILTIKNLDELKKVRTLLGNEFSRNPTDSATAFITKELYPALTKTRSNTLLDLAKRRGGESFKVMEKEIRNADRIYKKSIDEIASVIARPGKKIRGTPKKALEKFLTDTPEINRINKVLNTNDPRKIQAVEKAFPEVFDQMRRAKIAEIAERSMTKGMVDPQKLSKKILALPPESARLIFGPNALKKAKALRTYLDNVPDMVGPSGTPRGLEVFRFRFLLDNLQSLRRDFSLKLRTGSIKDNIFDKMHRWANSPRTVAAGVVGTKPLFPEREHAPLIGPNEQIAGLIPQR